MNPFSVLVSDDEADVATKKVSKKTPVVPNPGELK